MGFTEIFLSEQLLKMTILFIAKLQNKELFH